MTLKNFKDNIFLKNVAALMTGNGLAQVFVILISPVLTRLFTPAEIGVYASLLGIVSVFTVISSGRYEQVIVLAKTDREATNVFVLGTTLVATVSFIALVIIKVLLHFEFSFFGGIIKEEWAYSVPLINFFTSFYLLLRYYSIRKKRFKFLSFSMPVESIAKGVFSIFFGWFYGGVWGLIIAGLIGSFLSIIVLSKGVLSNIRDELKHVNFNEVKRLAKEHYKFPAYDAPNAIVYSLGQQGILIFIPKLFNESIAGIYAYTNRLLLTPVRFFSGSFAQVMYQKLSTIRSDNELYFRTIKSSTNKIFYTLLLPFFIFVFTSKYYIPVIFGENWGELYKFIYVMAPYTFMVLIAPAYSSVYAIDNKQDIGLLLKIIFVVFRLGIIFIGANQGWDVLLTFLLFSILSTISSLLNLFVYHSICKKSLPHSLYAFIFVSLISYLSLFLHFNLTF